MSKKQTVQSNQKSPNLLTALVSVWNSLIGVSIAAMGGWILYSKFFINHRQTILKAIDADRQEFKSSTGFKLSYYLDRKAAGRPLVLIHSINAAASAFEMRPLFNQFRTHRPTFALDLPGFGFSDRLPREYTPQLYEDAILDFLATQVGEPADVIALSLGCEFTARAALPHPELFHSLTFISPTGFNRTSSLRTSQRARAQGKSDALYTNFSRPLWRQPLFDLIATRVSIRFFLQKSFVGPVLPEMVDYAYASAHQPGAEYAPLYFISGKLFTPQIRTNVYEKLNLPTLVIYDRDAFTRFDTLPEQIEANSNWHAVQFFPSFGLPQFEKLKELTQELDIFLQD
jgi:pimeloyl-ACP methyl ester carboxylesterase